MSNSKIRESFLKKFREAKLIDDEQFKEACEAGDDALKKIFETSADKDNLGHGIGTLIGFHYVPFEEIIDSLDTSVPEQLGITIEDCLKFKFLPFDRTSDFFIVLVENPINMDCLDGVRFRVGAKSKFIFTNPNKFIDCVYKMFDRDVGIQDLESDIESFDEKDDDIKEHQYAIDDLLKGAKQGPAIKIVNGIISKALELGGSDIHIEPGEKETRVRVRVDGRLRLVSTFKKTIHPYVTSRIKIMSRMDISNTKTPQDGRIKITARQKDYDLRASTLPSIFGEKIVMRILDKSGLSLDLPKLGIDTRFMDNVVACIKRPTGMCLVTGPTGSGKTTTLYSFLNHVNDIESNIVTVEDPVEYQLKGINQVQINPKSGLTFASALRSILRQDPDIVMVGEIRDHETAEIAVHAAQTGHLVFSTLHTNDAPSTISRLLDIGIDPPTLAASLSMILAQRLARKLCPECKVRAEITHTMKTIYGFPDDVEFYAPNPKGCPKCHGIGYKGRLGIHEIIIINDRIRELVARGAGVREITMIAREEGMMTLFEDGINKMLQGVTSFEEVLRISVPPEDFHLSGRISADGERLLGINEFDHSKKNVDINESEVLIVDKSIEVSESISAVLQSKGFNVNIARDGEQAMDKLRHCNPLFLICDLNSEKIGGLEIIKRIRANKTLNSMRIIVISDNIGSDKTRMVIEEGADFVMQKPIDPSVLLAKLIRIKSYINHG